MSEPVPEVQDLPADLARHGTTDDDPVQPSDIENDRPQTSVASTRELVLQAELEETRALVDLFRARLEVVERRVAEMEQALQQTDHKETRRDLSSLETDPIPEQILSLTAAAGPDAQNCLKYLK